MKLAIYCTVVLIGMLGTRASFVAMRGGWASTNLLVAMLGFIGTFGTIGLLIWGFFQFARYWPIVLFAAGSVLQGILINRLNLGLWLMIAPALDLIVFAGGIWLVGFSR